MHALFPAGLLEFPAIGHLGIGLFILCHTTDLSRKVNCFIPTVVTGFPIYPWIFLDFTCFQQILSISLFFPFIGKPNINTGVLSGIISGVARAVLQNSVVADYLTWSRPSSSIFETETFTECTAWGWQTG